MHTKTSAQIRNTLTRVKLHRKSLYLTRQTFINANDIDMRSESCENWSFQDEH